jgi:hypothetical protein
MSIFKVNVVARNPKREELATAPLAALVDTGSELTWPTVAFLTTLPFLLAACCSDTQPRFWKVRDAKGGATAYTVDTAAVPTNSLMPSDLKFVDAAGKYVKVVRPTLVREMSEQEWQVATSGARYSLRYCGIRKACWAKAKDR